MVFAIRAMKLSVPPAVTILLAACFFPIASPAAPFDDVGLTALRAVTTNVDGTGIRVAQPEASFPGLGFEVQPLAVPQLPGVLTYASALGSTNVYPNSVGANSGHADGVAGIFYGPTDGLATNVAHVDNYDADFFITNYVYTLQAMPVASLVNQSFSYGALSVGDQQSVDSAFDDYAETFKVLFVSAVDNGGNVHAPGTSYNCIGVACYYGSASIGPTIDNGRCKPDLTAPNVFTSFATPYVSGAAALLEQAALRGDGGSDTNSAFNMRTIKALLLNGAVKPPGWTNGSATPLDARHGAGFVNVLNSYKQLAGGKHGSIVSNLVTAGSAHPPTGATGTVSVLSGWNFTTNTSSTSPARDSIHHYYFNVSNSVASAKFTATATLVWNRQFNKTGINNLGLFLYNTANSNLVLCSTSLVDNVEHIYTTNLAQGRYDLQVWKAGGAGIVSAPEPYALAWEFVPPPVLAISGGANPALTWPVYPAGFLVEARTNLISGAWSTNGFSPPAVTNGLNNILLNPTNGAQFFRLRKPNF